MIGTILVLGVILFEARKLVLDILLFKVLLRLRSGKLEKMRDHSRWAVVTGGGSGIGRGYCLALAKRGFNIYTFSRSVAKLQKLKQEVEQFQTKLEFAAVNFKDFKNAKELSDYFRLKLKFLKNCVSVIVNNVGTIEEPGIVGKMFYELENGTQVLDEIVQVNINPAVSLTEVLLPEFIKKNDGVIINISSTFSIRPIFGAALYSASKAFVSFFSSSMRQEVSNYDGIIVQTVTPSFVRTALIDPVLKDLLPNAICIDPVFFAEEAIKTVGIQSQTDGCLSHSFQNNAFRLCEKWVPPTVLESFWKKLVRALQKLSHHYHSHKKIKETDKALIF